MKILICDDEKILADKLALSVEKHLKANDITFCTEVYYSGTEALENKKYYDIAFLDVEIDEVNGTQIASALKEINPHIVIFIITSFNKYLDSAMDLNVFRFITKPIDEERLKLSIDKALEMIDNMMIEFYLRSSRDIVKVYSEDIMCIEVDGHGTTVITEKGIYNSLEKISFWKEKLSAKFFYSPHNSYIVNLKFITDFKTGSVFVANKFTVPVAYRKRAEFKKIFMNFILKRG